MQPDQVAQLVADHEHARLSAVADADVEAYAVWVVDTADATPGPPDFDRLMSTGIALLGARKDHVDRAVVQSLVHNPSERRLDIAAAMLCGLWHPGFRHLPIEDRVVSDFARLESQLLPDGDAAYSTAQALCKLLDPSRPETMRKEAAAALRRMAQRSYTAAIDGHLHDLIARALARHPV